MEGSLPRPESDGGHTPEALVKRIKQTTVEELKPLLDKLQPGDRLKGQWAAEVAKIRNAPQPSVVIAFVGTSGAGKSSLINALIGYDLVATSGVRACTSVITSISFNRNKNTKFEADVSFVTKEDWRKELEDLQGFMITGPGEEGEVGPDLAKEWDKISAVYPSFSRDEFKKAPVDHILSSQPDLYSMLGSKKPFVHDKAQDLADCIRPFIDPSTVSKRRNATSQSQWWPVIREVRIRCRSPVLSTGAVLVDLPGISDTNAARDAIARDYLSKCSSVFIVAPITRAATDRLAKELLGDAFRMQLALDGNYNARAITFIASKTDDIDVPETIKVLGLDEDDRIVEEERAIAQAKKDIEALKIASARATQEIEDVTCQIQSMNEAEGENQARKRSSPQLSEANPNKRRRIDLCSGAPFSSSTQNDHWHRAAIGPEFIAYGNNDGMSLGHLYQKLLEAQKRNANTEKCINDAQQRIKSHRRAKNAYCCQERSKDVTTQLRDDFREGMRESANSFTPDSDASFPLKVFACSAKGFRKMKKNNGDGNEDEDDKGVSCFENEDETGIPSLRAWCHSVTMPHRTRAANRLLQDFQLLLDSAFVFIDDQSELTSHESYQLKNRWTAGTISAALKMRFEGARSNQHDYLKDKFTQEFSSACRTGVDMVAPCMGSTLQDFYNSTKMHHTTFHALMSKYGVFSPRNVNVNKRLCQPFFIAIAISWDKILVKENLFSILPTNIVNYTKEVVQVVEGSGTAALKDAIRQAGELCIVEAGGKAEETIVHMREIIKQDVFHASRDFPSFLQRRLRNGYEKAHALKGKGRHERQQKTFKDFIEENKKTALEGAMGDLISLLTRAAEKCDIKLKEDLDELARKVDTRLSAVWEKPIDVQQEAMISDLRRYGGKVRDDQSLQPISLAQHLDT